MLNRRDRAKARDGNVIELRPRQSAVSCKANNWPLIILACIFGLLVAGSNASFAFSQATTTINQWYMAAIAVTPEAMLFCLPDQANSLWRQHRYVSFCIAVIVSLFFVTVVFIASSGFASQNISEASTVKAERESPDVKLAQRKLDTITADKEKECVKIGARCIQLRADEQLAIKELKDAREKVAISADPQLAFLAKLVTKVSKYQPSLDDLAMFRVVLWAMFSLSGGLVLMVAKKG